MSSKSPPYLSQLFPLPSSHYNTHSASSSQLNLPPNRSSFGQKSFCFMGAALWRSLPPNIQDTREFNSFYSLCQQHFMNDIWLLSLACAWYFSDMFFVILYLILIGLPLNWLLQDILSVSLWSLTLLCIFSFPYWLPQSSLWLTVPQVKHDLTWPEQSPSFLSSGTAFLSIALKIWLQHSTNPSVWGWYGQCESAQHAGDGTSPSAVVVDIELLRWSVRIFASSCSRHWQSLSKACNACYTIAPIPWGFGISVIFASSVVR